MLQKAAPLRSLHLEVVVEVPECAVPLRRHAGRPVSYSTDAYNVNNEVRLGANAEVLEHRLSYRRLQSNGIYHERGVLLGEERRGEGGVQFAYISGEKKIELHTKQLGEVPRPGTTLVYDQP